MSFRYRSISLLNRLTTLIWMESFLLTEDCSTAGIGAVRVFGGPGPRRQMTMEEGPATSPSTVKIQEVRNIHQEKRIASHSHINGLGLNTDGFALNSAGGFVGQNSAREVPRLQHACMRGR